MFSAILFPLTLGLFYFFTAGLWGSGIILGLPQLIAAGISGLASLIFGRLLFRSLKQGLSEVPAALYQTRRMTCAVLITATTITLAAFSTLTALETSKRAKPDGFDNYVMREQTRELEKREQQLQEWTNSPAESRSAYAPVTEGEISNRRRDLQRIRHKVEGADFRQWVVFNLSLIFVLFGVWMSFQFIRSGGMSLRSAFAIPFSIVLLVCVLIAMAIVSGSQKATINQNQRPIQSARSL